MTRPVLSLERTHPAIRETVAAQHKDIIDEVEAATKAHAVVVVGMAQNPVPRKVRALLKDRGIAFEYLEYGSYFSMWRRRNVLKMWTGWPTFPMVFVKGVLVGGFDDTKALVDSGDLQKLLA
jgi:monothiol glutaredoxin